MKTWCLKRGRNMFKIDFGWCIFDNVEELLLSVFLRAWAQACVCSLHSWVRNSILSYVNELVYVGSCPLTWALTCVHEMPSKSIAIQNFTPFSPVSLLYEILTHIFVIFVSNYHCIILFTFIHASQYHFLWISLESWI